MSSEVSVMAQILCALELGHGNTPFMALAGRGVLDRSSAVCRAESGAVSQADLAIRTRWVGIPSTLAWGFRTRLAPRIVSCGSATLHRFSKYGVFAAPAVNLHGLAFVKSRRSNSRRGGSARTLRRLSILSRGRLQSPRTRMGAASAVDAPTSLLDCGRGRVSRLHPFFCEDVR